MASDSNVHVETHDSADNWSIRSFLYSDDDHRNCTKEDVKEKLLTHQESWDIWSKPEELLSFQCQSNIWNLSISISGDIVVVEGPPSGQKWVTVYDPDGLQKFTLKPPDTFKDWPWFPWDVDFLKSGEILVSEEQSKQVLLYDVNGMFARAMIKNMDAPGGITVNCKNQIAVADLRSNSIGLYNSNGKMLCSSKRFGTPSRLTCPLRLCSNINDKIYVSDCWLNCIKVFDPDCNFLYQIGRRGHRDCQFLCPAGISCDKQGFIFIADELNHRIQVITPDGQQVNSYFLTHSDGIDHPRTVAMDKDSNLVVGEWNGAIKRFQYFQ